MRNQKNNVVLILSLRAAQQVELKRNIHQATEK